MDACSGLIIQVLVPAGPQALCNDYSSVRLVCEGAIFGETGEGTGVDWYVWFEGSKTGNTGQDEADVDQVLCGTRDFHATLVKTESRVERVCDRELSVDQRGPTNSTGEKQTRRRRPDSGLTVIQFDDTLRLIHQCRDAFTN